MARLSEAVGDTGRLGYHRLLETHEMARLSEAVGDIGRLGYHRLLETRDS